MLTNASAFGLEYLGKINWIINHIKAVVHMYFKYTVFIYFRLFSPMYIFLAVL